MGGFMPTPPAPAQPPQVKLDTTATSRGNFNKFLKNMNGATSLNPPSMAPSVGAATPTLAPTMSDIDIFNEPVAMMQTGGDPMDAAFSDFAGFSDPSDPFGGGDTSFVDDDPVADVDFNVVTTPTVTEQERQQNIQDAEDFIVGTTDFPSGRNFGASPNINFTPDILADIQKNINIDNLNELSMDDSLFKDNKLTPAGLTELNKMNAETLQLVTSGEIPASNFISAGTSSDILGDKDKDLGVNLKSAFATDRSPGRMQAVFGPEIASALGGLTVDEAMRLGGITSPEQTGEITFDSSSEKTREQQIADQVSAITGLNQAKTLANMTDTGLRGSLTPGTSQDIIDTAKNAIRASAGNNLAIDNLVAQFGRLDPSIGELADRTKRGIGEIGQIKPGDLDDLSGTPTITRDVQGPIQARTIFDLDTTGTREFRIPDSQSELDQAPSATRGLGFASSKIPGEFDPRNITETALGARNQLQKTTADEPPPIVAPGIGAPKEFGDMFPGAGIKVGSTTIPSIFSLANQFSKQQRGRVLDSIAQKGYTPVYGGKNNDVIVGARDPNTGILMEGIDPNAPIGSDDNQEPIIRRPIAPIVEEKKDDVKPPNIIGGTDPIVTLPVEPTTVVASPFAPATSKIDPVTFDSGQLNKLIELLTGVPAKPIVSAQEGGLIRAVDDFLATGT